MSGPNLVETKHTYDRKLKFNAERLKEIFGTPAAIEKR